MNVNQTRKLNKPRIVPSWLPPAPKIKATKSSRKEPFLQEIKGERGDSYVLLTGLR